MHSGYQPLGVWETERFLPVGTPVTVVGELAKSSDGKDDMVVRKPSGPFAGHPFYVTPKTFEELQDSLMRNTGTCKVRYVYAQKCEILAGWVVD